MNTIKQWMHEQNRRGHRLYLMLDSEGQGEARQALLGAPHKPPHISLYAETPVADLTDSGPFIFQLDSPDEPLLGALLDAPERNWGWLASSKGDDLVALAQHWRERLIIGQHPQQALYRFHDNRVLARALQHLPVDARPAYLGPIVSLCYWQGTQWLVADNPAPGEHALPSEPAWLHLPPTEASSINVLRDNIRGYLLAEHGDAYTALAKRQNPNEWLTEQLFLARLWGWQAPEQLHFFINQSLLAPGYSLSTNWQPHPGENPQEHFERLYQEVSFWSELPISEMDRA